MEINIYKSKHKYCYNNKLLYEYHNAYGPDETASCGEKTYYINGEAHNPHGPAIINSNIKDEYYLNGDELTKEQWEQRRHDY